MADEGLQVEVAFASTERQELLELSVPVGTSVGEAISLSRIAELFPSEPLESLPCGIWGREVSRATLLRDGDRVEIYRPLHMDPREARRRRAAAESG